VGIENPVHLIFIAAVALIVLGPKRLPALARALGQAVREFRASLDAGAEAEPEGGVEDAQPSAVAQHPPAIEHAASDSSSQHGVAPSSAAATPDAGARPGAGA
jgi:sec-independent protein translocase protein TatA